MLEQQDGVSPLIGTGLVAAFFIAATSAVYIVRTKPIPATIFTVAEHLCKNNDGVQELSRNVAEDEYNIFCKNKAEFRTVSITVTVKSKGDQLGSASTDSK